MDKEAQERAVNDLALELEIIVGIVKLNRQELKDFARLIVAGLDYHKLPKDKPPLLGEDERHLVARKDIVACHPLGLSTLYQQLESVAQAQREADIKFYTS